MFIFSTLSHVLFYRYLVSVSIQANSIHCVCVTHSFGLLKSVTVQLGCVCVRVCVRVCTCLCVCAHVHVKARPYILSYSLWILVAPLVSFTMLLYSLAFRSGRLNRCRFDFSFFPFWTSEPHEWCLHHLRRNLLSRWLSFVWRSSCPWQAWVEQRHSVPLLPVSCLLGVSSQWEPGIS